MEDKFRLTRFLDAQNQTYIKALREISNGKKESHYMWFIFPQVKGLGTSDAATYYGISNLEEAAAYLEHPVLRKHLAEISTAVYNLEDISIEDIFPAPDNLKLHSCMTLFSMAENTDPIFKQVLDKYFNEEPDAKTLELLRNRS